MNKLFAVLLISFNSSAFAQITNHIDVAASYTFSVFVDKTDPDFRTDEGVLIPSVLGNMKSSKGYRLSILYSKLSFKFQPGILLAQKDYSFDPVLTSMYDSSFNFRSTSVGITNKYNLLNYGHFKIVPYLKANVLINICKLEAPATTYLAIEKTQDQHTYYESNIQTAAVNELFVVPSFEAVAGAEAKLTAKSFLVLEFSLTLSKYPDIDMKSPSIYKEANVSIGFQYKVARNKRYYL